MQAVLFVLFIVGAVALYKFAMRNDKPGAPRIGPQGRYWWVKLLVALAVTVAVLYVVIYGYVSYVNHSG